MSRHNTSIHWGENLAGIAAIWDDERGAWIRRFRTHERAADFWTAVDAYYDMRSIHLSRWKPETREAIREAREATKRAYLAMAKEVDR